MHTSQAGSSPAAWTRCLNSSASGSSTTATAQPHEARRLAPQYRRLLLRPTAWTRSANHMETVAQHFERQGRPQRRRTCCVDPLPSAPEYCTQGQLSVMCRNCVCGWPSLVFQHRVYASCSAMSGLPGNLAQGRAASRRSPGPSPIGASLTVFAHPQAPPVCRVQARHHSAACVCTVQACSCACP